MPGPNNGRRRIQEAAAEAVVRSLAEGASHEEVSRAGVNAADAEYERLKREHEERLAQLLGGARPGPDETFRFWKGLLIAIGLSLLLVGFTAWLIFG